MASRTPTPDLDDPELVRHLLDRHRRPLPTGRPVQIQIVGLSSGRPSPIDGQWLVEYDPTRTGTGPDGNPTTAHIVCSPDQQEGRLFETAATAHAYWRTPSGRTRPDGQVDRPLTAFTVAMVQGDNR
jgi:hypothetical protein